MDYTSLGHNVTWDVSMVPTGQSDQTSKVPGFSYM